MRIIAGAFKGLNLRAPEGLDVRPTADRAREALFSILQKWPQGPFLDLFAGTGAVGLEALSRGYGPVSCVERDPGALACLRANAGPRHVEVLARDVLTLRRDAFHDQAVVFADPPYDDVPVAWRTLPAQAAAWMAEGGVLVVEARAGTILGDAEGLERLETRRYGAAEFHFFGRVSG